MARDGSADGGPSFELPVRARGGGLSGPPCHDQPFWASDPGPTGMCVMCGRLTRWLDAAGVHACHPGPPETVPETAEQAWQRLAVEQSEDPGLPGHYVLHMSQIGRCGQCDGWCVRYGWGSHAMCLPCFKKVKVKPAAFAEPRDVSEKRYAAEVAGEGVERWAN